MEVGYGISAKSIDWLVCLTPGLVFNILVATQLDHYLFRVLGVGRILPPSGGIGFFVYWVLGVSSGFYGWGLWQTILFYKVTRRLTAVFQTSGLKNAIGKLPGFVFDRPIDESTRRLRLTRANLPFSQFKAAKESLEGALQIYIDDMVEHRERGTVDVVYASLAMPGEVKLGDFSKLGDGKFLIGETRARQITFNFSETPHLLIGGQSGGGKSTFLRQMIATLYLNNRAYQFYLIDLKGGLEFQLFDSLPRVTVIPKASSALDYLVRIEAILVTRIGLLKRAGCKDLEAYLEKPKEERQALEKELRIDRNVSRIITVIDEAAELFMAGDKSQAGSAQKAKALAVKIAAQGRAVGVHLVIATQRPDVRAVDGQIKGNLSGALAFQMPNHASSMTILDNTRAAHLPKVPGRAVWKTGLETVELQTPFMTVDEANALLESFRKPVEVPSA
jgi:hypothetical protein